MTGQFGRGTALAGALLLGMIGLVRAQTAVPVAKPVAKPVAVVNQDTISAAHLEAVLKMDEPGPLTLTEAQRRQRQFMALSGLIDALLLHQFLDKEGISVTPAEVEAHFKEMEAGLRKQGKSLAEFCQETKQTFDQFRVGFVDSLRWSKYALPRVTEPVVQQYFQDNHDFFEGTMVRASHIVLRLPSNAPEPERARARAKLDELRAGLLAGRLDFAETAKAYSQDPRAKFGGDLDYFPRKSMFDENFARAAFALQVGQISAVVQTDYGLHLIKVTDRKAGKLFDYAANKEAVRDICMSDLFASVLAQQRKAAHIEINLP